MDKNVVLKEAQKYIARGQIDKAISEWEKLVKEAPDGNIYNTIGDLHLKRGDKKSAVDFFHRSATFFREGGFSLKALALYKKVINIDPSDAVAFTALGELSEEKGLTTDAIKYYITAAEVLSKGSNKEKFLRIYERILSLAPTNISLREKVAGLFLREGFSADAAREFAHIGQYWMEKGDFELARSVFIKVLDIQPNNKDALLGLIAACGKKGDLQGSVECAKKAVDALPDDQEVVLRCAGLLEEMGAHDEAIGYVSRIVEMKPDDVEANRLLGDLHLHKGERDAAWEAYKKVVDSLVLEDRLDEAIKLAREFKDINPVEIGRFLMSLYKQKGDTDALFEETLFVADLLMDSGVQDEAVDFYKEALKMRPDDVHIKKILAEQEMAVVGMEPSAAEGERSSEDLLTDAEIFIKYGLLDEAMSILEQLKLKEPGNVDVHTKLKSLFLEKNDKEQAVTECLILYEIYSRNGNAEMREEVLREATGIVPDDPRVLERMSAKAEEEAAPEPRVQPSESFEDYAEEMAEAEFYLRQGLKDDALRIYHKLSQLFPEEAHLQEKIDSVEGGIVGTEEPEKLIPDEPEIVEAHEMPAPETQPLDTDVLDIFEEFKKGLEKELEEEDFETHYNLGIAYKEMGLIDDAIKEFQASRNDPKYIARSMTMLGICYMDKGLFSLAVDAFRKSLDNIAERDESYWGAKYDLAVALERNGDVKEAFDIFSEIYGIDSKFREVSEKVDRLRSILPKEAKEDTATKKKDRVSYI